MDNTLTLGIDIGGTGIKAGVVDTTIGELTAERFKMRTPQPATPKAIANSVKDIVENVYQWKGKIGVGFPAIMKNGVAKTAANVDNTWIDTNVEKLIADVTGCPTKALNDADAAGMAEMFSGNAKGKDGIVILLTLGTGIGSAVFHDGKLLPNTELGHAYLKNMEIDAEKYCSNAVRRKEGLDWQTWASRFNEYLQLVELWFSPDLLLIGGGAGKFFEEYTNFLETNCECLPAIHQNRAGIIGAGFAALEAVKG